MQHDITTRRTSAAGAAAGPQRAPRIRHARPSDLDALLELEIRCFETDRLSRRSFRHMLTRAKAVTLVAERDGTLLGYALVLFHAGTCMARLYSVAVDPRHRGEGTGRMLLEAAEEAARTHGVIAMRLEIRRDNPRALALYRAGGYRQFDVHADYYEDHQDALRLEKTLVGEHPAGLRRVPYYEQTLEFTCGPAALIMAMKALRPSLRPDRKLELRLWREATTIFMTAGHGGCGPYGLGLAAYHRGFDVEVVVKDEAALFVDSVRSPEKKEVIALVQEDLLDEIRASDIRLRYGPFSVADLADAVDSGGVPLVLISSYRIYGEKAPHWVVVTGYDDNLIYVHDPYVDHDEDRTRTDCTNMPILKEEFEGMSRYGRTGQRAVVILRNPGSARRRPRQG
ncbi:MAG TPA: peptidase C39 family protein [Gammaproteobacteria bacterium]|nr:peptidase C39 family protein [Gammaproteobacteria bacterium]